MRETPNFGRENELAVWLLLALCVRKMELLSARWKRSISTGGLDADQRQHQDRRIDPHPAG